MEAFLRSFVQTILKFVQIQKSFVQILCKTSAGLQWDVWVNKGEKEGFRAYKASLSHILTKK